MHIVVEEEKEEGKGLMIGSTLRGSCRQRDPIVRSEIMVVVRGFLIGQLVGSRLETKDGYLGRCLFLLLKCCYPREQSI